MSSPLGGSARAMRALDDEELVAAMRAGEPAAWGEFDARFRPLLEHYARRVGIPRWEWSTCITSVLDDEAIRLIERRGPPPTGLPGYLCRAAHHAHLKVVRAARRRARHYADAAASAGTVAIDATGAAGAVLRCGISEATLRLSEGSVPAFDAADADDDAAVLRFAAVLTAECDAAERQLLRWIGEGLPRRQVATWLGIGYEAARKRVARLAARLRAAAPAALGSLGEADRVAVARWLRRAGAGQIIDEGGDDATRS